MPPLLLFVKTIEKAIRLCTVLKKKMLVVLVKLCPYYRHFSRIFRSKLSIYLQIYVKNGFLFKTSTQKFFFSTQCIILFIFLWFSQIKIGGGHFVPPPIITKVYLPLIITKVKKHMFFSRVCWKRYVY